MVDWVRDSSIDPFPITIRKNGVGVDLVIDGAVPATALVDGDLRVYMWKPLPAPQGTITERVVDVSAELVKYDAVDAPGRFLWFPTSADTRCNTFTLLIRDADGQGAFDENQIHGYTHGRFNQSDPDDNSRFNGL